MTMLLIAGIAVLAAGLLAVVFGIPVKEFSLGNTLILAGAVVASAGFIMLGLAVVVRELQNIARRLGPANPADAARAKSEPQLPVAAASQAAPEPAHIRGALAGGRRGAGSRARRWRAGSGAAGAGSGHQAAAQSAVLILIAEGTRTCGADGGSSRGRFRSPAASATRRAAGAERTCSRQL